MEKISALDKSVVLRPHQESAINKYLSNKNKLIFAHSLGSGKTITSLGAIERSGAKKALILTPAALKKNYKDSIDKFVTPDARSKYQIMSYEKFRRDPDKFMSEIQPDSLVVDEFHRMKDPTGKSFKAVSSARKKVKNFIGLTGTVMQNHPSELYPLLNISNNDSKYNALDSKQFNDRYTTIKKVYPKGLKGIFARLSKNYGEQRVLKDTKHLKKGITTGIDKNMPTPEFLSNFPKKEFIEIETPMTKKQKKFYDYFLNKDLGFIDRWRIKNDLPPKIKDSKAFFARLMHTRQAANSIAGFNKKYNDLSDSGKLSTAHANLVKHLKADPQHKAFVYSNFMGSSIDPLVERLKKDNVPYGEFSGRVPKTLKNLAVSDFNANKKRVLIASPSGAEGLDLKGVTLLQNLDPHWNPAKMEQVYGRAARFKSHDALPPEKRKVRIELYKSTQKPSFFKRLFGKKPEPTIDNYIYNRAKEKNQLVKQVEEIL